jgi:hypothetical protein
LKVKAEENLSAWPASREDARLPDSPYFLCVENYDRGEHHYRVYEPVGGDHEDAWREGRRRVLMKALRDLTHELAIDQAIRAIDSRTTLRIALSHDDGQYDREQLKTMLRYDSLHEVEGIQLYRSVLKGHDEDREGAIDAFRTAYACWRAPAFLPRGEGAADPAHPGFQLIEQELAEEGLSPVLNLAFHLGIAGLLGWESATPKCGLI